jgi:3-deoxy-D-manno-octulosonate 8-phosphate phosphatase (KDO 8-P phosphatase)
MGFFAANLQFLRKQRALPEAALASTLGIPTESLSLLEDGISEPSTDLLLRLSDLFEIPVDRLLRRDLAFLSAKANPENLQFILLDVDGCMTDAGMYYSLSGDQIKKFNSRDGLAIYRLIKRKGIQFGLVSSGHTPEILHARADNLGIQRVYTGTRPKIEVIEEWLAEMELGWEHVLYVGDDMNDLPAILKAGFSACPADATTLVKQHADIVLSRKGGDACIRELLEDVIGFDIS